MSSVALTPLCCAGGPNTNASQFFITYAKHPTLDGAPSWLVPHPGDMICLCCLHVGSRAERGDVGVYTIFGHVIDGMDTLDKMEKIPSAGEKFRLRSPYALYLLRGQSCFSDCTCMRLLQACGATGRCRRSG